MKIIVTTSDKYHHILPVFFYLYGKYWNAPFDLVGYAKPDCPLPDNCTWVSLGVQGDKSEWSTDLRRYFEQQQSWFIWCMEDTFLKSKAEVPSMAWVEGTGRCDLTGDIQKRGHNKHGKLIISHPDSRYRLSTQPSAWNRDYLLKYLTPGLSPWDFETQDPKHDGYEVIGYITPPLNHNEGVRRFDIYKLNLDGMTAEDIEHINNIAPWQTK